MSLHVEKFKRRQHNHNQDKPEATPDPLPFSQHSHWEPGVSWKSALNNLRLLLQPYWCWGWLEAWLHVFPVPGLKRALYQLMDWKDTFRVLPVPHVQGA